MLVDLAWFYVDQINAVDDSSKHFHHSKGLGRVAILGIKLDATALRT